MTDSFKILDFSIEKCDTISRYFNGRQRNNIMFFGLSLLDRLNFSSYSLRLLMTECFQNTKVEYSCGILLRSIMLDYLILLNGIDILIIKKNKSSIKKLNDFCSIWLADSIRHTINNIAVLYGERTPEIRSQMYSNVINLSPAFFEDYKKDGSIPIMKPEKPKTASQLFNTLKSSELSQDAKIYEAYLYYSKYDHFGQMFYELSREKIADRLNRMNQAIAIFPQLLYYTLLILMSNTNSDIFLNQQRNEVLEFMKELSNAN